MRRRLIFLFLSFISSFILLSGIAYAQPNPPEEGPPGDHGGDDTTNNWYYYNTTTNNWTYIYHNETTINETYIWNNWTNIWNNYTTENTWLYNNDTYYYYNTTTNTITETDIYYDYINKTYNYDVNTTDNYYYEYDYDDRQWICKEYHYYNITEGGITDDQESDNINISLDLWLKNYLLICLISIFIITLILVGVSVRAIRARGR